MSVERVEVGPRRFREEYGRSYEDFEVGDVYEHRPGRTITEADNTWFTLLTMNQHPLHFDRAYAAKSEFGRPIVNSCLTLSIVTGMSVSDVSQRAIGNLGWDRVRLTAPVFAGDTIYAETEVLAKRESKSRPEPGHRDRAHRRPQGRRYRVPRLRAHGPRAEARSWRRRRVKTGPESDFRSFRPWPRLPTRVLRKSDSDPVLVVGWPAGGTARLSEPGGQPGPRSVRISSRSPAPSRAEARPASRWPRSQSEDATGWNVPTNGSPTSTGSSCPRATSSSPSAIAASGTATGSSTPPGPSTGRIFRLDRAHRTPLPVAALPSHRTAGEPGRDARGDGGGRPSEPLPPSRGRGLLGVPEHLARRGLGGGRAEPAGGGRRWWCTSCRFPSGRGRPSSATASSS